ncbi:unnamed protein product, partial [Staurois parvus]
YWGCSQGVGLFPGNFFSTLLRGFGDIPGFRSTNPTFNWRSAEILSWSPQCGAGLHLLPFWATSFPLWDSPWTLRRFRRFCSGLVPVVFGPFSTVWDSPTIIGSLSGTSPRWP